MKVLQSLDFSIELTSPIVLTIGNFDGFHLGHQEIISQMNKKKGSSGSTVVVTFLEHPRNYFQPNQPTLQLTSTSQKLAFFQKFGVDAALSLSFTAKLANQTYQEFLSKLQHVTPFDALYLGKDACIGKNREGNRKNIKQYAEKQTFEVHYFEKRKYNGIDISSGRIRRLIQNGEFNLAAKLLGRDYFISVELPQCEISTLGRGLHLYRIEQKMMVSPPPGLYPVILSDSKNQQSPAIADVMEKPRSLLLLLYTTQKLTEKQFAIIFSQQTRIEDLNNSLLNF